MPVTVKAVELVRRMPTGSMRYYAIIPTESLFAALELEIVWGRLGGKCRRRREEFPSNAALERRYRHLRRRRERHDYVEKPTS